MCIPYFVTACRLEERCSTNKIKLKSVIFQTHSPDAKAHSRMCRQAVTGCSCLFLGDTSYLWAVRAGSGRWTVGQCVAFTLLWFAPGLSEKTVNQVMENKNKPSWNVVFPSCKICLKYIQIFKNA